MIDPFVNSMEPGWCLLGLGSHKLGRKPLLSCGAPEGWEDLAEGGSSAHAWHGQAAWGSAEPHSLLLPGQGADLLTCEVLGGEGWAPNPGSCEPR